MRLQIIEKLDDATSKLVNLRTDWTYPQAKQVLSRVDLILKQLPAAVKQAYERIIGERQVLTKNTAQINLLLKSLKHMIK